MPRKSRERRPLFPCAWSVGALAASLGLDRKVIYAAINAAELTVHRIGLKRLILTEDVVAWIKSKRG